MKAVIATQVCVAEAVCAGGRFGQRTDRLWRTLGGQQRHHAVEADPGKSLIWKKKEKKK